LLNGVEHANFFETRATEYSKGATRGNWQDVWTSFDARRKAKANDTSEDDKGNEPDMFGEGVAAE
jgi:ribonucleoside-diphosphate reductase beta chain